MRILIADDDSVSRQLLLGALRQMGHDVVAVADGRAACDALVSADAPQFAILDWMMPDLDGLAVCREIRRLQARYIYIILLTSRSGREDMVTGLAAGADDFLTKPFDKHELQARIQSGLRILDLQETLLTAQAALQHEATHDRLTGLWNRGKVLDHLATELASARRSGDPVGVGLVDIDHFKAINDTYGHEVGDHILRATADRMRAALRGTDVIGRYGGEEFLIVLGRSTSDGSLAFERVRRAVCDSPIDTSSGAANVTVSIGEGVARGPVPANELIAWADAALYRAKRAGRNRVHRADVDQESSEMTPLRSAYSTISV